MARPSPDRSRSSARPNVALQMQQQAMVQLIVGGVLVGALLFGVAWLQLVGLRGENVTGALPVLGEFMQAGARGDDLAAHALFSNAGVREVPRADIAALFARRDLFAGFDYLQAQSLRRLPAARGALLAQARVVADVHYAVGAPARLEAILDYDDVIGWRIRWIDVRRDSTP